MSWLKYPKQLFSLDTLDARLTTSTSTPPLKPSDTTQSRIDPARASTEGGKSGRLRARTGDAPTGTSPSRWTTLEFFVYYVVIAVCLWMMFQVTYSISKESDPNYQKYSQRLSPGWLAGRKVDNSDSQYSGFRNNLPYLFLLLTLHPLLRRLYDFYCSSVDSTRIPDRSFYLQGRLAEAQSLVSSATSPDARLERRLSFDVRFAIVFICALHGVSALKILLILYLNYSIATRLPQNQIPAATWIFNLAMLFSNELAKGYHFAPVAEFTKSLWSSSVQPANGTSPQRNWGQRLDSYGGLMSRWEVLFNITALRLISFNLDYYWALNARGGSPIEKHLDPSTLSEKDRIATPARLQDYSFRNYVAYALYSPLYIAGPIITFNDFISQVRYAPHSIDTRRTITYGVRFLVALLTMEVILHSFYVVAISKSNPAWEVYSPFQLLMLGYFNLHIIWLKLLLPWRLFRLWALMDGIDPPENMVRCMSNNYSALAFWRAWHRSYNRWILRYIYIPLGGSIGQGDHGLRAKARAAINWLTVFTFVAVWHDISLTLLTWGWLISLFVLPEVLATVLFPKRKWEQNKTAYRVICGIGAVINITMMMAANLIGFAIGVDGVKGLIRGIAGSYSGLLFLAAASAATFTAVQVMFEVREHELRHGYQLKC